MQIPGASERLPLFLPHRTAQERHREDDVERGAAAGRIHENRLQAEEDRRTGVHRHQPTGGRLHGRTTQAGRPRLPELLLFLILPYGVEAVGSPGRDNERHHIPQRTAHIRRHDARPRSGHLHGAEAPRTPGNPHDPNLRKGHGQEEAGSSNAHPPDTADRWRRAKQRISSE